MAHNLEGLMNALFDCATANPSAEFHAAISRSLQTLGTNQSSLFLSAAHTFLLQKGNKLSEKDRAFVLGSLAKVLGSGKVLDECDEQQALLIINLTTQEMTLSKDSEESWASAGRDVLVTLSKHNRFVGPVMDALLHKFPPGLSFAPHKYVILTLAAIAQINAFGFVPFLTDILSRTVPLLSHLKNDSIRSAFSQSICAFCESVIEFSASNPLPPSTEEVTENGNIGSASDELNQNFADQFESAYELVFPWTASKDLKCRADAVECVGTLCMMIPKERIMRDLKRLTTLFLSVYKKASSLEEQLAIAKGVVNFLDACCTDETLQVEHYLHDLFDMLFPHVCVVTEQSFQQADESGGNGAPSALQIKLRNEAFRCFHVASSRFADKQVYYLFHKMVSEKESVKLGATNLMRHLLNSAGAQMEEKGPLIAMGLKQLLVDDQLSIRVKMSLCQLCVSLADNGYIQAPVQDSAQPPVQPAESGSQYVMQFLLTNLVLKSEQIAAAKKSHQPIPNEAVALNQLHTMCAQALNTIANTCSSAQKLLWPLLFEYICVAEYTPVVADIYKCLRILCTRIRESGAALDFQTDFDSNPRLAGPLPVLSRLLVCMNGAPLNPALFARSTEALRLLGELSIWFHAKLGNSEKVAQAQRQMLAFLEEMGNVASSAAQGSANDSADAAAVVSHRGPPPFARSNSHSASSDYSSVELRCVRNQRWQSLVLELQCQLVTLVDDQEWAQSLAAAQAKQLSLYADHPQDKAFLMRCIGSTLARIQSSPFVTEHALLLFRSTAHSQQAERVGCAMAIGHCASREHTDLVLTELENVAKWEHTSKKSGASGGGFFSFSFIKDAMGRSLDLEVLNLRATLVLSYGYVVYNCPVEGLIARLEQTVLPFLRQYIANSKEVVVREAHLETINLIALSVNPAHLKRDYKFEARYECFSYIKQYVQAETPVETLQSWIRLLAAKSTASLVQLEPPLSENELWDVANILTQQTFPVCRERSGLKTLDPSTVFGFVIWPWASASSQLGRVRSIEDALFAPWAPPSSWWHIHLSHSQALQNIAITRPSKTATIPASSANDGQRIDDDEASTVMDATVMQFRSAIAHIVARRPCVEPTISQLLKMFIPFYGSSADHERSRAIDSTVLALHVYSDNAADCTLGHASDFVPLCSLLGRLCPRLCDSLYSVRVLAIRAVWLAFKLSLLHRGNSPRDADLDTDLFNIAEFTNRYLGNEGPLDSNKCHATILAITKEVEARLPQSQVQLYLSALFKMLSDRQSNVSSAAAQLLSCMVSDRGHLLHLEAEILIMNLLDHLAQVRSTQTYMTQTHMELLNGFTLFTAHQQYTAVNVLLRQPLPYSDTIVEVWGMMARDHQQFPIAIDYVLDMISAGGQFSTIPATTAAVTEKLIRSPTPNASADMAVDSCAVNRGPSPTQSPSKALQQLSPGAATSTPAIRPHFELLDLGAGSAIKVVSSDACALIAALTELVKKGEPEDAVNQRIPTILASLLAMLAAVVDTQYPSSATRGMGGPIGTVTSTPTTATSAPPSTSTVKKGKKHAVSTSTTTAPLTASSATVPTTVITSELCRVFATPAHLIAQAIKVLLTRIDAENVIDRMNAERAWTNIVVPQQYLSAVASFCRSLCDFQSKFVGPLMVIMASKLDAKGPTLVAAHHQSNAVFAANVATAERIAAAAVLASLVTKCPQENGCFDSELFATTFHALQEKALKDPNLTVRKLAIQGIGQVGALRGPEAADLIAKYSSRAVEAALGGLDDSGDRSDQLAETTLEAMDTLVPVVDQPLLTRVLPQLLLKLRPCFEKENGTLRVAAFSLFASLGRAVGDCDSFRDNLHNNIVALLLHLNDADETVQLKCAIALHTTAHLMHSEHASTLVEHEIVPNSRPPIRDYTNFLKQFSMILAISFPDRLNYYALTCANYFKSQSSRIRQNAAQMTGFLMTALTPELRGTVSKDLIFSGLVQLLKDPEEEVRLVTASAISLLYDFA